MHDKLGENRSTFPLTCYLTAGTQADKPRDNELILMRLSNMHGIDKEEVEDEESDDENDEEAEKAKAPRLHAAIIPHHGDVNRVKVQSYDTMHLLPPAILVRDYRALRGGGGVERAGKSPNLEPHQRYR